MYKEYSYPSVASAGYENLLEKRLGDLAQETKDYTTWNRAFQVLRALKKLGIEDKTLSPEFLEYLVRRYFTQKRYLGWMLRKVKANGGYFPKINKTLAIKEFLARGFVHREELKPESVHKFRIHTYIGELAWPKTFNSQIEAQEAFEKVGIHGYTKITFPINHNK